MFTCQEALDKCEKALLIDPPDTSLLAEQEAANNINHRFNTESCNPSRQLILSNSLIT